MTDWLSIPAEWLTNIPDDLSGLTDQPTQHTGLSVWADWQTKVPAYPCNLNLADWPPSIPDYIYKDWKTNQHAWISIRGDWLTPACLGWLTNQHTSLSIRVDWPTNIPDYIYGMTDQPTFLTIWVDWPTNIPTFLSDWQTYLTIYPFWDLCTYQGQLTNQYPVTYEYIFGLTASLGVRFVTIMSKSRCKVCHQHEQVSV